MKQIGTLIYLFFININQLIYIFKALNELVSARRKPGGRG